MRLVLNTIRADVVLTLIALALALSQRSIALHRLVVGSAAALSVTLRRAVNKAVVAGRRAKYASIFVLQHLVRRLYFSLCSLRRRLFALPDRGPCRCFYIA